MDRVDGKEMTLHDWQIAIFIGLITGSIMAREVEKMTQQEFEELLDNGFQEGFGLVGEFSKAILGLMLLPVWLPIFLIGWISLKLKKAKK